MGTFTRWIGALVVLAGVAVSTSAAAAAPATAPFTVVAGPTNGYLTGVSAESGTDVWACGWKKTNDPLIEHYDGTAWAGFRAPKVAGAGAGLMAISAASDGSVWTVGQAFPAGPDYGIAYHLVAGSFVRVRIPAKLAIQELDSVLALSDTNVWAGAVVATNHVLIHWNGTKWTEQPDAGLTGDADSRMTGIAGDGTGLFAVGKANGTGTGNTGWFEQSSGTTWHSLVDSTTDPPLAEMNGISASGPTNVWAVGEGTAAAPGGVAFQWDGMALHEYDEADIPGASGDWDSVAASSPTDVWVSGEENGTRDLAFFHYDGGWSVSELPTSKLSTVDSMTTVPGSPGEVWGVGWSDGSSLRPLIVHYLPS